MQSESDALTRRYVSKADVLHQCSNGAMCGCRVGDSGLQQAWFSRSFGCANCRKKSCVLNTSTRSRASWPAMVVVQQPLAFVSPSDVLDAHNMPN
eukprot:1840996-Amphidinium_carterae.1